MEKRNERDPFEFSQTIIPPGLTYQWCAKTLFGEPNPSYESMIEGGWFPVPKERHPGVFRTWDSNGNVCVGGQVLMARLKEFTQDAHDRNADRAHRNALATHRTITLPIGEFNLSQTEMSEAETLGVSCAEYARRRANAIADGRDRKTVIVGDIDPEYGPTGKFKFAERRVPRKPWLHRLFNLISTES